MKTLFIDTHSDKINFALIDGEKINSVTSDAIKQTSEVAMPLLNSFLKDNKCTVWEIDEIVVVNGPGSFTGVRIGVTIAKTIAFCTKKKIKTITSLEALGVSSTQEEGIVTVPDSKGVYNAYLKNDTFTDYSYLKKSDFENYITVNNYKVIDSQKLDYAKILDYLKDKEYTSPHAVNPVYIKEIDVLK